MANTQIIELPDGTELEFPADATDDVIRAGVDRYMRASAKGDTSVAESAGRGAMQGVTYGLSDEMYAGNPHNIAGAFPQYVEMRQQGVPHDEANRRIYEGANVERDERLADVRAANEKARMDNPNAYMLGEIGGAIALPGVKAGAMSGPNLAVRSGKSAALAGTGGALYGFGTGEGVEGRVENARNVGLLSSLVGGAAPPAAEGFGRIAKAVMGRQARNSFVASAPTADALKSQASDLYTLGRQTGTTAGDDVTTAMLRRAQRTLEEEGLLTPSGKVSPGFEKVRGAIQYLEEYAGQKMSPEQMQAARKAIKAAADSTDPAEKRIGVILKKQFDQFIDELVPEFAKGREVYQRAKNAELIDQIAELAGLRATQYTQSGVENALRTEFRGLSRKQIKGKLPGITDELADMIKRVAEGGRFENLLRDVGRAAPTSMINIAATSTPAFLAGNAAGGPVVGAGAAGLAMLLGGLSRKAAGAMKSKNVELAKALAATGESLPAITASPEAKALVESLVRRSSRAVGPAR